MGNNNGGSLYNEQEDGYDVPVDHSNFLILEWLVLALNDIGAKGRGAKSVINISLETPLKVAGAAEVKECMRKRLSSRLEPWAAPRPCAD